MEILGPKPIFKSTIFVDVDFSKVRTFKLILGEKSKLTALIDECDVSKLYL